MISNTYQWYPIHTKPRAEKKAFLALERKNITTYLPLKTTYKQWSDRKKWIKEPLIQSYLFVYISASEYMEVLNTNGISNFILFSKKIATIPIKQIEDLKLLLANEADLEVLNFKIDIGQKVIIYAGPFKGITAELVSLKSRKNIVLRLQSLGCSINIKTSMAFIKPY